MELLVIEDDPVIGKVLRKGLSESGHGCMWAKEGPRGLELACGQKFDAIVLDLMLPGMSGYAVCEAIRQAGNEVPVLMLSARTLTEDRVRGYDVGADQYLAKPFELEELLSVVRNLLTRRAIRPATSMRPG